MPSSLIYEVLSGDSTTILRRLVQLRLLVLGLLLALLWFLYQQPLWPIQHLPVSAVIFAGIGWSLSVLLDIPHRVAGSGALLRELILDGIWLTLVVYFSGRSANPFIYYFLVLVAIGAVISSARVAWSFSITGILVYTLLLYLDMRNHFAHMGDDYRIHLFGMWVNFVGSSLVTCYFISKLAAALRDHQRQLSKIREDTLKDEQLVGIGTLAAATVHALGTPLSTLTILLNEIRTTHNRDDIQLMLTQIQRCKETMAKLSLLAEQEDQQSGRESVANLFDSLHEHYAISKPLHAPQMVYSENCCQQTVQRSLLLRHALINLVDNAIAAAHAQVDIHFHCSNDNLLIDIIDDGPGIASATLRKWGQPQRSNGGLGIGAFLANSTIEKLGGTVAIQRQDPDTAAPSTRATLKNGGETPEQNARTKVTVQLPLQAAAD